MGARMKPFTVHRGIVATLDRINVDTDQIIPKQFLKRIERTGFGQFLFYDWRFNLDGELNMAFELNAPRFKGASILVTRANFGCGSSREHAPWALRDYGFCAILAPSFADIFYNNCFQNGLLPIRLPEQRIDRLFEFTKIYPGYQLTIDLEQQKISDDAGETFAFEVEPFRRESLLKGLDDIGLTLLHEKEITEYEAKKSKWPIA
jgi:3-isopropylmalate/(R)-2-methylmalate dehydratase small subunit